MERSGSTSRLLQLTGVLLAAGIATAALFLLMLALMSTGFVRKNKDPQSRAIIVSKTEPVEPTVKVKLFNKDKALLNKIELPPAIETKAISRSQRPKINHAKLTLKAIEFSTAKAEVNLPNLPAAIGAQSYGSFGQSSNLGSGGNGAGRATSNGANHCTLVAHIGPTLSDVKEIEFMDCQNGNIADLAEIELYRWINGKAKSYLALGAKPGDAVEFTYEKKS